MRASKNINDFSLNMPKASNICWIINISHDSHSSSYNMKGIMLIKDIRYISHDSHLSSYNMKDPSLYNMKGIMFIKQPNLGSDINEFLKIIFFF